MQEICENIEVFYCKVKRKELYQQQQYGKNLSPKTRMKYIEIYTYQTLQKAEKRGKIHTEANKRKNRTTIFCSGIENIKIKLLAHTHERSRAAHTHNKLKHGAHTGGD